MTATNPTRDHLAATTPLQLRALSHPLRHRILRALGSDGATVSQLSNRLQTNKGNVAHHLSVLVAAGLARRGPTRTVRGGTEQYFLRAARKITFDPGDQGSTTKAMLSTVADEIPLDGADLLHFRVLRLTPQQAEALSRHLDRLVDELPEAPDGEQEYGVLVGVYRRP